MSDSDSDFDDAPAAAEAAAAEKTTREEHLSNEPNEFDDCCDKGMAHVKAGEWVDAAVAFEKALAIDKKEEGDKEVSEERADCAFNLACCHAQTGHLDKAEQWLRRAVSWGVRGVDLMNDADLAPLRDGNFALFVNLSEAAQPRQARAPAVLQRSRRDRRGGQMAALIKQEKERQASRTDDDDVDEFWKDEDDDGEFSDDGSDHEHRDWFDSDFDESEEEDSGDEYDEHGEKVKKKKARGAGKRRRDDDDDSKYSSKPEAAAPKRSRRAAAEAGAARTAAEVAALGSGDEADDDDFADAEADRAIAAAGGAEAFAGDRAAPTARDAIRAARRAREVDAEAAALGLGDASSDDDAPADAAPAPEEKPKKKKKKDKKPKKKGDKASSVLAGIFGAKAAASICKKADKAVQKRAAEGPGESKFGGKIVRKRTVVEEKRFGGETIQIARTVRDAAGSARAPARAAGRVDDVLEAIKGPKAVTTVAKSSADWDVFKEKEGLEDSLKDAGQKGYLAKQEFLDRADHRAFERERDQRNAERAKQDQ